MSAETVTTEGNSTFLATKMKQHGGFGPWKTVMTLDSNTQDRQGTGISSAVEKNMSSQLHVVSGIIILAMLFIVCLSRKSLGDRGSAEKRPGLLSLNQNCQIKTHGRKLQELS